MSKTEERKTQNMRKIQKGYAQKIAKIRKSQKVPDAHFVEELCCR